MDMVKLKIKDLIIDCKALIFDKDGTLTIFESLWIPLIKKRAYFVALEAGENHEFEEMLLENWGINPKTLKIDPRGPCPVSPRNEEIVIGTAAMYRKGYLWDMAKKIVMHAFDKADSEMNLTLTVKPVKKLKENLYRFKKAGLLLAVATSDERKDTEKILSHWNVLGLFDTMVCSGEVTKSKPHPEILFEICKRLKINPNEAIFLGDTINDMITGKKAKMALNIGVTEGGVVPKEELEKFADIVIGSLSEIEIINKKIFKENFQKKGLTQKRKLNNFFIKRKEAF